jgi:flagellar biosynthesis protein FlhA
LEDRIRSGFDHNEQGMFIRMSPQAVESICRMISVEAEKLITVGHPPIALVSPQIRAALKQMTAPHIPQLIVLSYNEITRDTKIDSLAMVTESR